MTAATAITKLDGRTFDELLRQNNPFTGTGQPLFDLSGISFVTPSALVQLTAACHAVAENGQKPRVLIPDSTVRSYLGRAGFFLALDNIAEILPNQEAWDRAYEMLRGNNPLLIEVTKIASGAALPDLLNQVVHVLRHRLKYKKHDAFDIATAISELSQNTFDHNSNTCGFLAMQVYGKNSSRFLEIGVADYGFGLAVTLSRNPNNPRFNSDIDAIRHAIQLGTSEHDDPTRGTGLYHLLEIVYKHGGSVQIRSGAGVVRYRGDQRRGWQLVVPRLPGVQVALTLPTKAT